MGVLPFGVYWAASIFQATMCNLFLELLLICLKIYIDNLLIHSLTRREHLLHLREVFAVCREANLHLRFEKCTFMVTEIKTLGFIISHGVIKPDPIKIDMLLKATPPSDRTSLRGFLALLQQFRTMLVHLSHVCHKLYELTSTKVPFIWTEEHNRAFLAAKDMISKKIMNTSFDPNKKSMVLPDASKYAVCAILLQEGNIVACTSRTLNKHQRNWATIEREQFALSNACKKFRIYLLDHNFITQTDHKPLLGLQKKINSIENQRLLSMILATTEFSFDLEYIPGKKNVIADYGTRHIPDTDWPVQPDDPLELNSLFPFNNSFASIKFPNIQRHIYSLQDYEEWEKFQLKTIDNANHFSILVKNKEKILVPYSIRRSIFWAAHFPAHQGMSKLVEILKERHLYWPNMKKDIAEFLSTCICAIKKTDKTRKKGYKKNWLTAERVLQVLAIDIYDYEDKHYLTFLDIFSEFPFLEEVCSKEAIEVKRAFDKFCALFAAPESIFRTMDQSLT